MECVEFPSKWKKRAVLLQNIHAVDTTIFKENDSIYCFVYTFNQINYKERKLYIGTLDLENNRIYDLNCVVEYENNNGRPGGNCFYKDNCLVRVVQPSLEYYGEKIVFYSFSYDKGKYIERKLSEIKPCDIKVKGINNIDGVHTYNFVGNYEIVDIRINFFDLLKPFKRIFRKLGLFGFIDGDKKKIKVFKKD